MIVMMEFFDMGGYGAYIWPSFAITAAVLIGMGWQSYKQLGDAEKELTLLKTVEDDLAEPEAPTPATAQTAAPTMEGKPHEA